MRVFLGDLQLQHFWELVLATVVVTQRASIVVLFGLVFVHVHQSGNDPTTVSEKSKYAGTFYTLHRLVHTHTHGRTDYGILTLLTAAEVFTLLFFSPVTGKKSAQAITLPLFQTNPTFLSFFVLQLKFLFGGTVVFILVAFGATLFLNQFSRTQSLATSQLVEHSIRRYVDP